MKTFNDKVRARANFAAAARTTYKAVADEVGLLEDDLATIENEGRNGGKADAEQKAQLAEGSASITIKAQDIEKVLDGQTLVRAKVPAVVADLKRSGQTSLALFLQRVSFDVFRIRELKLPADAPAPSDAEAAELKKFERVEREDHLTRLAGFANWIDAMRRRDVSPSSRRSRRARRATPICSSSARARARSASRPATSGARSRRRPASTTPSRSRPSAGTRPSDS